MKPIKTLVLLANDEHARLFENTGAGKGIVEVETFASSILAEANVRFSDRPGRNSASPGVAQHAFDQTEAEHDQAQAAFAKAVIGETVGRFTEGGFSRFVLVAGPDMLGVLRAGLPQVLKGALVTEVAKDYLKLKPTEIVDRLAGQILL